jgi:DNA-binding transcriptional MerR regulator
MPEARYYSPKDASHALAVSAATLRRWSELFAAALSADASPEESGTRRRYTADDMAILRYAQRLIAGGHQIAEVSELLRVATPADLAPPEAAQSEPEPLSGQEWPPEPAPGQDQPSEPSMALMPLVQNVQAALTATLQRAASQERLLADQAERLTRQEREIADQRERLAEQEKALEATERQLGELAERLATLEERRPEPAPARPVPWWQKLFGTGS